MTNAGGLGSFDITDETFDGINRDLRGLGFSGSKASYELRKICIDHIYQWFGAEKAVSISGGRHPDDFPLLCRSCPAEHRCCQGHGPDRVKL